MRKRGRRWARLGGVVALLLLGAAASSAPASSPTAERLRGEARTILSDRAYRPARLPRPLHGVIRALSRALAPVGRALSRLGGALEGAVPGGRTVLWPILAVLVLLAGVVLARRSVGRRVRAAGTTEDGRRTGADGREDARVLEREAADAERRGELDLSLRLRFRAGLVRLDAREAILLRPSSTTGEVARRLRSPDFDQLAATYEQVAYGGRPAGERDLEAARATWDRVLERPAAP